MVPAGQNQPQQHPVVGVVANTGQMAYSSPPYATPSPSSALTSPAIPSQPLPSFAPTQQHYAYQQQAQQQAQQFYQSQQQQQQQELQAFWANQMQEIEQTTDFKNHSLPLARIKKIMKADEDVRMISAEAPVVFAKACEMFIFELTMRSWIHTEENKRRTLQKSDIGASISRTDVFDFLVDVIPREDLKEEEGLGGVNPMENNHPSMADSMPYYYHQMGGSSTGGGGGGMMMGQPVDPSAMYMNNNPLPTPPPPLAAYMPWPPAQQQESHEQSDS